MGNFQKLRVWQLAKELAVRICNLANEEPVSKDFGFKDQIRRAAISIPANIAEGDELGTDKQSTRHFFIAKGSSAELMTLLIIGSEIGYIKEEIMDSFISDCRIISVMLAKLIKARS
ncbi:MAG: four helix bundle protein [Bacteroidales bacterium]|nr:four helix bundle protein [Bacteroidales bacterium]